MMQKYPTIFLIRHGETHWNIEQRFQGQKDSPLTLNGIAQAQAVANSIRPMLGEVNDVEVWSSPIGRARQTAAIACEIFDIPFPRLCFDKRLMERNYGDWEGRTLPYILLNKKEEFQISRQNPWSYRIPENGESLDDVRHRVHSWLIERPVEKQIIAIMHSGSGRVLRNIYTSGQKMEILTYNEPQTSSFVLNQDGAKEITLSEEAIEKYGCQGEGVRTTI